MNLEDLKRADRTRKATAAMSGIKSCLLCDGPPDVMGLCYVDNAPVGYGLCLMCNRTPEGKLNDMVEQKLLALHKAEAEKDEDD
jgi:hypothetical protein